MRCHAFKPQTCTRLHRQQRQTSSRVLKEWWRERWKWKIGVGMHVLMHDFLNQTHAACQHMHVNAGSLGRKSPSRPLPYLFCHFPLSYP